MIQFILPVFLILASVGVFFGFTKAQLATIDGLKAEVSEFQKAVDNSNQLLKRRDELLFKKNQIPQTDLARLGILMPDDVNSTKLILEIQNLATNIHGLKFENPKYDPSKKVTPETKTPATTPGDTAPAKDTKTTLAPKDLTQSARDFGTFELEFTIIGPYEKFISFIEDLEKSLRVVDIQQVEISPKEGFNLQYVVKVQTYWLKS